mgnify:CR=1 FL=1
MPPAHMVAYSHPCADTTKPCPLRATVRSWPSTLATPSKVCLKLATCCSKCSRSLSSLVMFCTSQAEDCSQCDSSACCCGNRAQGRLSRQVGRRQPQHTQLQLLAPGLQEEADAKQLVFQPIQNRASLPPVWPQSWHSQPPLGPVSSAPTHLPALIRTVAPTSFDWIWLPAEVQDKASFSFALSCACSTAARIGFATAPRVKRNYAQVHAVHWPALSPVSLPGHQLWLAGR